MVTALSCAFLLRDEHYQNDYEAEHKSADQKRAGAAP
jgi:hypothetical protein